MGRLRNKHLTTDPFPTCSPAADMNYDIFSPVIALSVLGKSRDFLKLYLEQSFLISIRLY